MASSWTMAENFLAGLSNEEKNRLYNDLIMVNKIHTKNQHVNHYSLRKIRRASHRLFDDRKRSFQYTNENHDELLIQQIQEQHLFKTCYKVEVFLNTDATQFAFIEDLLVLLKEELQHSAVHYATI